MGKIKMRLELTPKKIIPEAITVWNQPGEADVIMDLKKLTFRENYFDEIFSFHVLDHLFENEINEAMLNWRKCLKPGGQIFIIVDDFEYLAREFVGGGVSIDELNTNFAHPTNITRENLLRYFIEAGYPENSVNVWFQNVADGKGGILVPKQHYELIYESRKTENS